MNKQKVYIVSACRSAIGSFGASLADQAPAELAKIVAKDCLSRSGLAQEQVAKLVEEVVLGNVLGAGHGMNQARQVALKSGLPVSVPAYTVNKVCGSGLKAVSLGASAIAAGELNCVMAGGVESMSQTVYVSKSQRFGSRMGNSELIDLMLQDGLSDAFHSCHMGITAENLADKFQISRAEQDQFALESQGKAKSARDTGHFKAEITPIPLFKKGTQVGVFEQDEYIRDNTTLQSLSALRPAFKKDGTVTAGNASGINDGAAILLLMSERAVKETGLKPMVEILGWASAGVEPELMGLGPVHAVRKLLKAGKMELDTVDLIEANEAFAVQALAVGRSLEGDSSRVNVCGGAIALGHPIGASGARVLVTLLYQMKRLAKEIGLATLCVGGGQGVAMLIKNL